MIANARSVAAYARVSTVGQNEEGQRREIAKWLPGQGITNIRWFVDKETGDHLDRPAFRRLQQDIFDGEVEAVVVWKLDRLSRSIIDGVTTLAKWCEEGIRVVSVTQQLDFQGALGKLLAAIFYGVAEMEQETRRERQRVGIEAARERGVYRGRQKGTTKTTPSRAHDLLEKELPVTEIALVLGVSRRTVERYLTARP